jgi:hypothetical protein
LGAACKQTLEKSYQVVWHDPFASDVFALHRPDAMMIGRTENNSNTFGVPAKQKLRVLMFLDDEPPRGTEFAASCSSGRSW